MAENTSDDRAGGDGPADVAGPAVVALEDAARAFSNSRSSEEFEHRLGEVETLPERGEPRRRRDRPRPCCRERAASVFGEPTARRRPERRGIAMGRYARLPRSRDDHPASRSVVSAIQRAVCA